jgi:alginate O-acetyltransferase complex protein AlgI
MLFTSGEFLLVYLPIVVLGFFTIAKLFGRPAAAGWLVLGSIVFYGFWRPEYVPLLLLSIGFNYVAGYALQNGSLDRYASRKTVLGLAIAVNLLVLAYYKYADFLLGTANYLFGTRLPMLGIVLPIGISFFTFTQIAYLVDSYAAKVKERNTMHYALFVSYFPHLISGPVLHHADMMPQFAKPSIYSPRLANFAIGASFLAMGLVKKVLIADSAAPIANNLFDSNLDALSTSAAWLGTLAYTLQIYFDFSGYSDMAVGLSLLIGVRLPYNFNSPYKARSIIDFWRRWHMTLSRFLRDYLYVPLGGNRLGVGRRYANLAITMLLGGLWHGASWTFVVWGGLHGLYLVINHGWRYATQRMPFYRRASEIRIVRALGGMAATVVTLAAVIVAWTFFRAHTASDAARVIAAMVGAGTTAATQGIAADATWLWIALGFAVALFTRNSQELIDGTLTKSMAALANPRIRESVFAASIGACAVVTLMMAAIAASRGITEFIYFNF